jgi:hypothetical protein
MEQLQAADMLLALARSARTTTPEEEALRFAAMVLEYASPEAIRAAQRAATHARSSVRNAINEE